MTAPPWIPKILRLNRIWSMVWTAGFACLATSVASPVTAVADVGDALTLAVQSVRGTSCAPLRSDPMVQQAAVNIAQSNDRWLNHDARAVPVPDPLPLLKDIGYAGTKADMLLGTSPSSGDAIKALLLQGYAKIPDCSFTTFGSAVLFNQSKQSYLTAVVLAA